jgi:hypothetical protein
MATEQDLVLRLELSESDSGTNSSVENSGMKFDSLNKQNFGTCIYDSAANIMQNTGTNCFIIRPFEKLREERLQCS